MDRNLNETYSENRDTSAWVIDLAKTNQMETMEYNMNEVHLESRDVNVWFNNNHVLADVSLSFPMNSVTALIGPSGCGKSSFVRTLNRMHETIPGAGLTGEVLFNGKDIYATGTDPIDVRLNIGMVFQKPNPFPTMTIKGNILSGLRLSGKKVNNESELVEKCLTRASLWNEVKDRLDSPAGSLSGGQQQRLCIARSLALDPSVLLMDEPCSALDPGSTNRIEETIRELSEVMTIVIVTHNMQQAQRVSDQTAFFLSADGNPGEVVEFGATKDIFSIPRDQRTEDYVNGRFG
jgi:phosphate transport system ATP-binding protein